MVRFLLGVIVGIVIFALFIWVGGGAFVKKVGEGLTDTGKKMEALEEVIQKEKNDAWQGVKKKLTKEGEIQKKTQ
jgi:hypothetical protein